MVSVSQTTEKSWPFILIGSITVNADGIVTCSSTKGLRIKQIVTFDKAGQGPKDFEIKRIMTDTTFLVGDPSKNIGTISKPIEYNGGLAAVNEQQRNTIGDGYVLRNVYENDPVMALRNILVDEFGNFYNETNPFPVNVEVTVGEVTVNLDAFTLTPDNVLMVGSEDGTKAGIKHVARVDSELDLRVGISDGSNKATVNPSGELSVDDAALDVNLSTRASEATLASIDTKFDVNLSTRASEATVLSIDTKFDVNLSTRASEATLLTRATEATLLTRATEATLLTRATEATLLTRATEATLATRATEATLLSIDGKLNSLGQKPMAGSVPVVLASDQTPIPVTATVLVSYEQLFPLLANANFMKVANYDAVIPTVVGNTAELSYIEDTFEIAKVTIVFNDVNDWDLTIERYVLNDDGVKLDDDDGTFLFLE